MQHTYTRICAALIACSIPLSALAVGVLRVDPSVAGLGLDVQIQGAETNAALTISIEQPNGNRTQYPVSTDGNGNASAVVPGSATQRAGTYTVSALKDRQTILGPQTVTVEPETIDARTSSLQAWSTRIQADGRDAVDIDVTLRDRYGNLLTGRPVSLVSSRVQDVITMRTPQTNAQGVQHFALTTTVPGTIQLRALDLLSGTVLAESATVEAGGYAQGGQGFYPPASESYNTYYAPQPSYNYAPSGQFYYGQVATFDVIDHFEIDAPLSMRAGEEAQKFTVRAVDRSGVTVENYLGTVVFSSTDPAATFPASYTFRDRDLGEKTFPLALKFKENGQQTFRVEDRNDPRISGSVSINVGGGSTATTQSIIVSSHQNDGYVNALNIVVEGNGPRFANIKVMGGTTDAFGSSDDTGFFSIPVTLNPNQRDFTLRVMDDTGRNDSGPIHLILDQDAPTIASVTFAPEEPTPGQQVLVVVQSEPALKEAVLRLSDNASGTAQEIPLNENQSQSGSYQAFFTAPDPRAYQPDIRVTDRAGNSQQLRVNFRVGFESIPTVQNVQATARIDAIDLSWDAVEGAEGYRVYIGDSPVNYLYSLDTGKPATTTTVRGLTAGKKYIFTVTALREGRESEQKSQPVESTPLGFTLTVTPENGALHVQWDTLKNDLPLSSFLVEYGVGENQLTENRMINGELRDFTIRDLLNDVQYFVRVTPITVTGEKLRELAATGNGTPGGGVFTPRPGDDLPFDVTTLPDGTLHPAPSTPASGVPAWAWMSAVVAGVLGVTWRLRHRRKLQQTTAFLQAMQSQYYTKG